MDGVAFLHKFTITLFMRRIRLGRSSLLLVAYASAWACFMNLCQAQPSVAANI